MLTFARVRLAIECPDCMAPIPVNGMVPSVLCDACRTVLPLEGPFGWDKLLVFTEDEPVPELGILGNDKDLPILDVLYAIQDRGSPLATHKHDPKPNVIFRRFRGMRVDVDLTPPQCGSCKTPIALTSLEAATPLACGCGAAIAVRRAPPEATKAFARFTARSSARIQTLVGETALTGELSESAPAQPVLFACLGCGAALPIDGSERLVTCRYCNEQSYLPDALWLRLHPAAKRTAWFIGFNPPSERRIDGIFD